METSRPRKKNSPSICGLSLFSFFGGLLRCFCYLLSLAQQWVVSQIEDEHMGPASRVGCAIMRSNAHERGCTSEAVSIVGRTIRRGTNLCETCCLLAVATQTTKASVLVNAAAPVRMPDRRLYSRLPAFPKEGQRRRLQVRGKAAIVARRMQGVGMRNHLRADASCIADSKSRLEPQLDHHLRFPRRKRAACLIIQIIITPTSPRRKAILKLDIIASVPARGPPPVSATHPNGSPSHVKCGPSSAPDVCAGDNLTAMCRDKIFFNIAL